LKVFSTSAGRSGLAKSNQPLKILLAVSLFNFSSPLKNRTLSDPCHLYPTPT